MNFYELCFEGDLYKVKEYIRRHRYTLDWDGGFRGACVGGHLPIVQLLMVNGAKYWDLGLANACRGGHSAIINLMIEKGADDWNSGLIIACNWDRLEVAALMLDRGASNLGYFKIWLLPDQQLQVYGLVTKNEARLRLERHSPTIKERLQMTTIIVLNDRLPDHLIRTIVMEYV